MVFYTRLQFVYQGFCYVQVLIHRPFAKFVKVQQRIWSLCKCKGWPGGLHRLPHRVSGFSERTLEQRLGVLSGYMLIILRPGSLHSVIQTFLWAVWYLHGFVWNFKLLIKMQNYQVSKAMKAEAYKPWTNKWSVHFRRPIHPHFDPMETVGTTDPFSDWLLSHGEGHWSVFTTAMTLSEPRSLGLQLLWKKSWLSSQHPGHPTCHWPLWSFLWATAIWHQRLLPGKTSAYCFRGPISAHMPLSYKSRT